MKNLKKYLFSGKLKEVWLSLLIVLVVFALTVAGVTEKLDFRFYDLLMKIKPATVERDDVVIVAIDDASIGEIGTFPWSRDIIANAIIRMRELGAESVTFDIEYVSPSQKGVNPSIQDGLSSKFQTVNNDLVSLMTQFSDAITSGSIPLQYVDEVTKDIINSNISPEISSLYNELSDNLFRDNDEYFAQALHYFGNSWLTINAADMGIKIDDELEKYTRENLLLHDVTVEEGLIAKENDIFIKKQGHERNMTPALLKLVTRANGAGFTNVILDDDGTRRRIELLQENKGDYIGQLVFSPLLNKLDTKELERKKNKLIIKNALLPGETIRKNISIPLDKNGRMLINWIKDTFVESFKYESVLFLYDLDEKESQIVSLIKMFKDFKLTSADGEMLSYYNAANWLYEQYEDLENLKKALLLENTVPSRKDERYDALFKGRKEFFEVCDQFCDISFEKEILTRLSEIATFDTQNDIQSIAENITEKFARFREYCKMYNEDFERCRKAYEGAFCIVGHTASNSTDLGTTPFEGGYANIGTHANVYNTIMSESFITPLSNGLGMILSAILLVFTVVFVSEKKSLIQNVSGLIGVFIFPVLSILLIVCFNVYLPVISPFFVMTFGFVAVTILRFIVSEKDKSFLRSAFSTYLSEDVVAEIVNDPSKLTLGGEERNMTAIFTDIRSFSTLSEKVTPSQLVSFLNKYLTLLSDIILENRGTIDKYEGDAIIAFFGAPISFEDHAWYACLSAIRMKQAEAIFNKEMLADGTIPTPVYTRIGINTGSMVVGNMGTNKKMNYTMMGNDVNLAARLEGVNKVYRSWILISEATWNAANSGEHKGKILVRCLDKVRVVGIYTPVQLYNVVGLVDEIPKEQKDAVDLFHQGLALYLKRDFERAKQFFDKSTQMYPSDEQGAVFADRCSEFIKNGVPDNWDGVINMTSK